MSCQKEKVAVMTLIITIMMPKVSPFPKHITKSCMRKQNFCDIFQLYKPLQFRGFIQYKNAAYFSIVEVDFPLVVCN